MFDDAIHKSGFDDGKGLIMTVMAAMGKGHICDVKEIMDKNCFSLGILPKYPLEMRLHRPFRVIIYGWSYFCLFYLLNC
jgi:hypothetical protein